MIERTLDGDFKIEWQGRGTCLCSSETEIGVSYAVDIFANSLDGQAPLGSCTCKDFEIRRIARYQIVQLPYDHFRCKHLRAVRSHFLNRILMQANRKDS